MEARAQRVRDHIRRPDQLTMRQARSTVIQTDPLETALASLVPPGPVVPLRGVDLVFHTEPKHHDD